MDSETQEKIYDIIFYFIHAVPRLKQLFLRWCKLSTEEKYYMDDDICKFLTTKGKLLYTPLKQAFVQWDYIQDTQGAPGFEPGCHEYKCDADIEKEITKVINTFERCLDNFYNEKDLDSKDKIFDLSELSQCLNGKLKRSKSLSELGKKGHKTSKKNFTHLKQRYTDCSQSNTNSEEEYS